MARVSIRILVALALFAAFAASASLPIPRDEERNLALPAVALEQSGLYRLEVALAIFYGGLLLITPAYSGLVGGRLPIEISARGARFAEEADQSAELAKAAIEQLEKTTKRLVEDLAWTELDIERLKELTYRDNTQLQLDSKR